MNNEKMNNFLKELISWALYLGAGLLISLILINYVFRLTVVSGESMNNTLQDSDVLYVDKLSYFLSEPKRGDIVICNYPGSENHFVKRIIGLPGETVEIKDNVIYINGVAGLDNWNGNHTLYDMAKVSIPDDSYFVVGDNRNNSKDSRVKSVGTIKKDEIQGRALFRIYPFSSFGSIEYKY